MIDQLPELFELHENPARVLDPCLERKISQPEG
jgi:hypothetical protein